MEREESPGEETYTPSRRALRAASTLALGAILAAHAALATAVVRELRR